MVAASRAFLLAAKLISFGKYIVLYLKGNTLKSKNALEAG